MRIGSKFVVNEVEITFIGETDTGFLEFEYQEKGKTKKRFVPKSKIIGIEVKEGFNLENRLDSSSYLI
jgi:hypothetical protein